MARAKKKPEQASPRSYSTMLLQIVLVLAVIIIVQFVVALFLLYVYQINLIDYNTVLVYGDIALSLLFPVLAVAYLFYTGTRPGQIIRELGLSKDKLTSNAILMGILLFFVILIVEAAVAGFSYITGIQLPTNVDQVFGGQPLYFLLFAAFIAPIAEETFFRGLLVPRIGIVPSAIVFGIAHAGYGSISELLVAFLFGLLAGYFFKKTRSLYVTIAAHMLVNVLAVAALIFGAGILS